MSTITRAKIATLRTFAAPAVQAGLLSAVDVDAILSQAEAAASGTTEALLTAKEVAERWGCCSKTVLRLADEGRLTRVYLRPGKAKSLRFRLSDVQRVMQPERIAGN